MEGAAVVVDEFGEGRDLEILTDAVEEMLVGDGESGGKDVVHKVY